MNRRVLVAPMDWGLGHATRCIPLIRTLLELDCTVFVAGSGPSLEILKEAFPALTAFFELPSYGPMYARSSALMWKLARQFPRLLKTVRQEQVITGEIVRRNSIDVVISDNRYGCYAGKTVNFFIGHQMNLPLPAGLRWLGPGINYFHRKYLEKFDGWWVPDWKGSDSLAGDLSQTDHYKAIHLGPLSRFDKLPAVPKVFDVTFVLSGPEPQRTMLEERIITLAAGQSRKIGLVRGVRDRPMSRNGAGLIVFDLADSATVADMIAKSEVLVARPGYSTIMDLAHTGGRAVFVPTPGQAEQEYLARRLERKGIAGYVRQSSLDLDVIVEKSARYKGFEGMVAGNQRLKNVLRAALRI